jgi:nucleotide-binding universal stress UspA family protein
MTALVSVGLDGSRESHAAVDWAAREALRRGATLKIVHVREVGPYPYSPILDDAVEREWSERETSAALSDLSLRYPELRTTREQVAGRPVSVLTEISGESSLLVLGSRGFGRALGFLVGSVALPTVAHARCPVVLVRVGAREDGPSMWHGPVSGPVVVGVKLESPAEEAITFAFEDAARRSVAVRAVNGWSLPPALTTRPAATAPPLAEGITDEKTDALSRLLEPWRERFPSVQVECHVLVGTPARGLVEASEGGSLLVVGRRPRRSRPGVRIGAVTQSALHHADLPVAVVPAKEREDSPESG